MLPQSGLVRKARQSDAWDESPASMKGLPWPCFYRIVGVVFLLGSAVHLIQAPTTKIFVPVT